IAIVFGLDESLIIPSRMDEINWIAKRPKDSSLDTTKARKLLDEKPYDLKKALKVLKEEMEG
ncbi:MAG: dTDP-4-dehydrorhamnose reductase, partial [Methanosarcinales archaeon]|nr:dTDP-4-dehydrorhamnose reductase [Methanosarcinales archaeon]